MQIDLKKEFGDRMVTLFSGADGLRGGLHVEARDVKDAADEMDFIASDESLDRYNEKILADGWDLANYRKNPVVVDSHDYSSVGKILGSSKSVAVQDGRLTNRVRFAMDNPMGSMAYKMAKGGFIKSQSVGFIPIAWQTGKNADEPSRTYTKSELLEISLVAVPANPGATIGLALKSGAIVKNDVRELMEFLKQFCNDPADPAANARASGGGIHDAQLMQLARALADAMRRD